MPKYADVYLLPIAEDKVEEYKNTRKAGGEGIYQTRSVEVPRVRDVGPEGGGNNSLPERIKAEAGRNGDLRRGRVQVRSTSKRDDEKDNERSRVGSRRQADAFDYRRMVYGGFKVIVDL